MMGGGGSMMGNGSMMGMMGTMMGKHNDSEDDFKPMDMCKEMMSNLSKSRDIATYATPEVRQLFEEWVAQVDDEILDIIKSEKDISPEKIAEKLKISKESALYFLTRLAQKGKVSINISNA
jgi:predicted HTH transcriptional regulator